MILNLIAGMIGYWQIILIVVIVLLLFGGKKIPELMKGIGRGVKEFKDGINDENEKKTPKEENKK